MENEGAKRNGGVQSVERAVSILQVLARRGPTAVTDLGAELGLHKSTAFRLLATLEGRGLVEQNGSRGRYQLAYGVVQLAAGATRKLDLTVISRATCEALAEDVGETVDVDTQDENTVLTIHQVVGSAAMTTVNWVGRRTPLHATSAGKVFLAHLSPARLEEVLDRGLERFTENTVTDRAALLAQLAQVREHGYGFTLEEYETGLAAVAAPIRDLDDQVVATISVSGPNFRLNAETIPDVAVRVIAAATEVSERLGHPKPG